MPDPREQRTLTPIERGIHNGADASLIGERRAHLEDALRAKWTTHSKSSKHSSRSGPPSRYCGRLLQRWMTCPLTRRTRTVCTPADPMSTVRGLRSGGASSCAPHKVQYHLPFVNLIGQPPSRSPIELATCSSGPARHRTGSNRVTTTGQARRPDPSSLVPFATSVDAARSPRYRRFPKLGSPER
jgi:hypothetical protein